MKVGPPNWIRLFWNFENETFYRTTFAAFRYHGNTSTFLSMGFALTLGLVLHTRSSKQTWHHATASAAAVVLLIALYYNTSRAGWLLGAIIALLFAPRFIAQAMNQGDQAASRLRQAIVWGVGSAMFAILLISLFGAESTQRGDRLARLTTELSERFPITLFVTMIPDTPFFGHGPGTFSMLFPKYQLAHPGLITQRYYFNEAHQDYFQFFFDWGISGFACWMCILIFPLGCFIWTKSERKRQPQMYACFVGALAMLIHAVMDFPFQITSLFLFYSILLACLITLSLKQNPPPRISGARDDKTEWRTT